MKKILVVIGTRPEAIKLAPVIKALGNYPDQLATKVCATAQHREMLDQVFDIFDIKPDYDLNLMQPGQDLFNLTTRILLSVRDILNDFKPDLMVVHGDTTTSMASSLAAFYLQIQVAHVEAGLRTQNILAPWPEEMNRQITARIADLNFAPTEHAKTNLINEGISDKKIWVTGNTVIDALDTALEMINADASLAWTLQTDLSNQMGCQSFDFDRSKLILVTGHRRENFGSGFINICHALSAIADNNPQAHIVYPVHLNANVRRPVYEILGTKQNIHLMAPLEYLSFLFLMDKSHFILTDSGGIQEEAPSLGKPVLVMRETTERPEAVQAGTAKLVGTDKKLIIEESQRLMDDELHYGRMSKTLNPYGNGEASYIIANTIVAL
jgi:UDP-N-acetylglucosamine 2-epimerase (non-hydrolysing)